MIPERHVALFNVEANASIELKAAINGLVNTKVVLEVTNGVDLTEALQRIHVNLVIIHLDPLPETLLQVVEHVANMYPDIPIIGISENTNPQLIISAMRAGCSQFVIEPLDKADFSLAVDRVTLKHEPHAPAGKRICVVGSAGGVGVTTISCNLAMELAHLTEKEVAIADLQLEFGDVANLYDCNAPHTIADMCEGDRMLDATVLEKVIVHLPCHVAVLARPHDVEQAGQIHPDRAAAIIRMLSSSYDNVVVDTPRELNRLTLSVLEQADHVLLVLQLTVPSVQNATRLFKTLISYGMPEERIHVVVNRFRKNVGQIAPTDIEKHFKKNVFATIPNDYQCVANSLDFGHPLMATAPDSSVRTAIRDLARLLIGTEIQAAAPQAKNPAVKKGRLFARIFGS